MFDKNYFLDQLRKGQSIDTIGQGIADAMNEAVEAYEAEQAIAMKAQAEAILHDEKRAIALDMIDLLREYGELVMGDDTCDFMDDISDEDLGSLIQSMDQLFNMMKALTELKAKLEKVPATNRAMTDDDVLANFIRSLS